MFEKLESSWHQVDERGERWEVRPGRLGVKFEATFSIDSIATVLGELGVSLRAPRVDLGGYYHVSYDDNLEPPAVLRSLLDNPYVEHAYLDTYLKFFAAANDSFYTEQWNLAITRVDRAWDVTTGAGSVTIAVIDRGFEIDHDDFSGIIWINPEEDINHNGVFDDYPASSGGDIDSTNNDVATNDKVDDVIGWDFTSDDNIPGPTPSQPHGTQVAGIACALSNNGMGIAGVAGGGGAGGVKLMLLRLASYQDAAPVIEYASREGADVICMSWGSFSDPGGAISTAIENAYANGTVLFAATGNWGQTGPGWDSFPSTHPDVIAIGSSDENDEWISRSNYGPHLDLVAPSTSPGIADPEPYIWTTDDYLSEPGSNPNSNPLLTIPADNGKYWGRFAGTSAACPVAAGVAALVKSHMPSLSAVEVRERLLRSAVDIDSLGFDWKTGWGRVDAYRTLTEWGTINASTIWSPSDTHNGVRYVSGDLTIATGATLTIMPGTTVKIANDDDLESGVDEERIEINVHGTLIAEGTTANPIVFESWHPTTSEDWVGVYFDSLSGGGTFDHCVIKRAEYAIESYVALSVTNTAIDTCRYVGIISQAGGALVQGCSLLDPGSYGIFLTAGDGVIRNTSVDNATATALHVQVNAGATVRNSQFLNSNWGLFHAGTLHGADVDSSCTFSGNASGLYFLETNSSSFVKRCDITGNAVGVFCEEASATISINAVTGNGSGIECIDASPLIAGNEIKSGTFGVVTSGTSQPDIGHYPSTGDNTIALNDYDVYNDGAYTVYAQNNCWGNNAAPCMPSQGQIYGSVLTTHAKCCTVGEGLTISVEDKPKLPTITALGSITPNPFNPTTSIRYDIASAGLVELRVYDVAGRLVRELVKGHKTPGNYYAIWNGLSSRGESVASGIYFARMTVLGQHFTKKMVLLK